MTAAAPPDSTLMPRHRLHRLLRRVSDSSGANLVEAALITPLLLLLTFAIVDFASLFYVWMALENGVSQASRYGVTGNLMEDPDDPGETLSREGSLKLAMRESTPTLTIADDDFSFSHLPAGGTVWTGGTGGPNDIGRIAVTYTWTPYTPLIRPFFDDGQFSVTVESAMKNEGWSE